MIDTIIFKKNKEAAYRIIESQAVILTPENNYLHTLNLVGTYVWNNIDGKSTLKSLKAKVCKEFDAQEEKVEKDLKSFLEDLIRRKLVVAGK